MRAPRPWLLLVLALASAGLPGARAQPPRREPPPRGGLPSRRARPPGDALPPIPSARPPTLSSRVSPSEWASAIGWPAALPAPQLEAISTVGVLIERHRFGDGVVELRARSGGDGAAIWRRFVEAMQSSGTVVEREWLGGGSASATVCAPDCASARYFVSLSWDSWVWLTLRRAVRDPPRPPGACEAVPSARWSVCWTASGGARQCSLAYATRFDVDVDRDGAADALVPIPAGRQPERSCPADIEWDLYVTRGDCGHRVARLRGDVSRWHAAGAELAGGYVVLTTAIEPATGWDDSITIRNAFSSGRYREVALTNHGSRCDVHPADCDGGVARVACAVRGHPTILAPFDVTAAQPVLVAATQVAQRDCAAAVRAPVSCAVDLEVLPDGSTRAVRVRDCGAARACVRGAFAGAAFDAFSGEPQAIGTSFRIAPP